MIRFKYDESELFQRNTNDIQSTSHKSELPVDLEVSDLYPEGGVYTNKSIRCWYGSRLFVPNCYLFYDGVP